jgi:hypothetical protein
LRALLRDQLLAIWRNQNDANDERKDKNRYADVAGESIEQYQANEERLEDWREESRKQAKRIRAWCRWHEWRMWCWAHARRCAGAAACGDQEHRKAEQCENLHRLAAHRTGSNPPALSGEQRAMRLAPIQEPFSSPYFTIASSV